MTRLSKSSQNKTAHRDRLMVGSFLVGEELVRFEVLVEIVNLVRPTVENAHGYLCGIVVQRNGLAHIQHRMQFTLQFIYKQNTSSLQGRLNGRRQSHQFSGFVNLIFCDRF